jgi:hypothetical protein
MSNQQLFTPRIRSPPGFATKAAKPEGMSSDLFITKLPPENFTHIGFGQFITKLDNFR